MNEHCATLDAKIKALEKQLSDKEWKLAEIENITDQREVLKIIER